MFGFLLAAADIPGLLAGIMPDGSQIFSVFLWFVLAAVLGLAGFYAVMAVRRWVSREETVPTFTIQDLRDMRNRGDINDHEFVTMRAKLLAQLDLSAPADTHHDASSESERGEPDSP